MNYVQTVKNYRVAYEVIKAKLKSKLIGELVISWDHLTFMETEFTQNRPDMFKYKVLIPLCSGSILVDSSSAQYFNKHETKSYIAHRKKIEEGALVVADTKELLENWKTKDTLKKNEIVLLCKKLSSEV